MSIEPMPQSNENLKLQNKIGWICQSIRWLTVLWLVWMLFRLAQPLFYLPHFVEQINAAHNLPEGTITQQGAINNRLVALFVWACTASIGVAAWNLMSTYLRGEIFSEAAAVKLKRLGQAALFATVVSIALRPLLYLVMSQSLLSTVPLSAYFMPQDLLYLLISIFILSLAQIYHAAAEINAENESFV